MPTSRSHATRLVLLSDNNDDTRQLYGLSLRSKSYEVDEAEDGAEALAKTIAHRPSLVVTDARLPLLSGVELCHVIRTDATTASIPVIVITADDSGAHVRLARAAGAESVLLKPCLPDVLADEVRRVLARHAREREDGVRLKHTPAHPAAQPPGDATVPDCALCNRKLTYIRSHVAVSHRVQEQWDYFECPGAHGMFERRQRTGAIRSCSSRIPHLS